MKRILLSVLLVGLLSSTSFATDDHVLLTEAVATPTAGEFIEIYNPTGSPIDLTNYYLSDDEDYALLPGASGAGPAPSIGSSDFIAQFPSGTMIPAGGVLVIAFSGAGFITTYAMAPDFEIIGDDVGIPDMIATDVGSTRGLTDSGEHVVVFFWDGASDLVQDVDMFNIGTPSSTNDIGNKTGLAVDGPDVDAIATSYFPDAGAMPLQLGDPGLGVSTKRIALEAGNEPTPPFQVGGNNGITGDDETSENIQNTFDGTPARPFTAPDPGQFNLIPLPVELTTFDALTQNGSVLLQWTTGTETDNAGFEVEMAPGARYIAPQHSSAAWQALGYVEGTGTTREPQSYRFRATDLEPGTYRFRLKQIDFDGTFAYSPTVLAVVEVPGTHMLSDAYPNPFNPSTQFVLTVAHAQDVRVEIYDGLGRKVRTLFEGTLPANTAQTFTFKAGTLPTGLYLYRATGRTFSETRRVMLLK